MGGLLAGTLLAISLPSRYTLSTCRRQPNSGEPQRFQCNHYEVSIPMGKHNTLQVGAICELDLPTTLMSALAHSSE